MTKLAATLEQVATDTYLAALPLLTDTRTKALMASVMGVEAQHLAILRTITALFDAGASDLIVIPADAGRASGHGRQRRVPRRVRRHHAGEPTLRRGRAVSAEPDEATGGTAVRAVDRQFLLAGGVAAVAVTALGSVGLPAANAGAATSGAQKPSRRNDLQDGGVGRGSRNRGGRRVPGRARRGRGRLARQGAACGRGLREDRHGAITRPTATSGTRCSRARARQW